MRAKVFRYVKIAGGLLSVALLTFLAVRIYDTQSNAPAIFTYLNTFARMIETL